MTNEIFYSLTGLPQIFLEKRIGTTLEKQSAFKPSDLIYDPQARILATTGLGGLAGAWYGYNDREFPMSLESERVRRALITGLRGAIMGTGVGALPTMLGI